MKNCDLVFTVIRTGGLEECTFCPGLWHRSHASCNHDGQGWTLVNPVQGETEKEARDCYNYYVHQQGELGGGKEHGRRVRR